MAKPRKTVRKPSPSPPSPGAASRRSSDVPIYLALAAITLAVYWQTTHFEFLNYDDPAYVLNNPRVRAGLTGNGIVWAFTSFHAANWSPVTWLSHMMDCQLFGMRSGWHHLTSVLIHIAAALLLFGALKKLTGSRWPSAFVAFLFALHPLHVESVAWIAERKDVLCAFFWFLALYWYADYVRRPSPARYLLVVLAFCLGLMAKSMIVTLPFVLLLLDFWPLRRTNPRSLIREKLPLVAIAACAGWLTVLAQQSGNAVRSLSNIPLGLRVENALVAYGRYIFRMFWPANLAAFYPYRFDLANWEIWLSAAALLAISALAVQQSRVRPYLLSGWLWYLGTLAPVIGLVQVGAQSSADRYSYVPIIGLAIMLAWDAADLLRRQPKLLASLAAAALAVCVILTWQQVAYWRDSETLFQHAVEVTTGNYLAFNNLGEYYLVHNQNQKAVLNIQAAIRIRPAYPDAHANLALAYRRFGEFADAEREYREALTLQPSSGPYHGAYAALLLGRGRLEDALGQYRMQAALQPDDAQVHYNLGTLLMSAGHTEEAIGEFTQALRLQPDFAEAQRRLEQAKGHR